MLTSGDGRYCVHRAVTVWWRSEGSSVQFPESLPHHYRNSPYLGSELEVSCPSSPPFASSTHYSTVVVAERIASQMALNRILGEDIYIGGYVSFLPRSLEKHSPPILCTATFILCTKRAHPS